VLAPSHPTPPSQQPHLPSQVLDRKLASERYLRASGLNYTIVRPGGLTNEPAAQVLGREGPRCGGNLNWVENNPAGAGCKQ
jgi:hypothetical protein